jgi:hypothetical protein
MCRFSNCSKPLASHSYIQALSLSLYKSEGRCISAMRIPERLTASECVHPLTDNTLAAVECMRREHEYFIVLEYAEHATCPTEQHERTTVTIVSLVQLQ